MKQILYGLVLLLVSCESRVSMDTPQKHAIATFIAGATSDPSTYRPIKLTKDSAFTQRDLLLLTAKTEAEDAESDMEDSTNLATAKRDTMILYRATQHYAAAQRKLLQLQMQKPGKRIGDFYTHTFYYKTRKGEEEYQEVNLRVYDSALVVKTLNGYGLELL
jgi:hypothetical protein